MLVKQFYNLLVLTHGAISSNLWQWYIMILGYVTIESCGLGYNHDTLCRGFNMFVKAFIWMLKSILHLNFFFFLFCVNFLKEMDDIFSPEAFTLVFSQCFLSHLSKYSCNSNHCGQYCIVFSYNVGFDSQRHWYKNYTCQNCGKAQNMYLVKVFHCDNKILKRL